MTDLYGVAAIIAALGVAVPSVVAAWVSVINLNRGNMRDAKLEMVHQLVNGQSTKLEALTFKEGHAAGVAEERADPHVRDSGTAP